MLLGTAPLVICKVWGA